MHVKIHPSILSADFMNLEAEFASVSAADSIHVDVMDGHFVPNLTLGLPVVKRMQEVSKTPLDVHLMIENADELAFRYADLGVASVTFHAEAAEDIVATARKIKAAGAKAGVAVKPGTALEEILANLNEFDMVLIMTVEPGFGGQTFMTECLPKIQQARSEIDAQGFDIALQVDGGIDLSTIKSAAASGADTFVAGTAIFSVANRKERIAELRHIAAEAR